MAGMEIKVGTIEIKRTDSSELRTQHDVNSPRADSRKKDLEWSDSSEKELRKATNSPGMRPVDEEKSQFETPAKKNKTDSKAFGSKVSSLVTQVDRVTVSKQKTVKVGVCDRYIEAILPHLNDRVDHATLTIDEEFENSGLLKKRAPEHRDKKCLVLDLDETLVHSSFQRVPGADFLVPIEINDTIHEAYVLKRPYADEFLYECSKLYEIVIFTASVSKYANPLLDRLDTHNCCRHRLFREDCAMKMLRMNPGNRNEPRRPTYIKDLDRLGRRPEDIIFIDNSPQSYLFHPSNAIPIPTWYDDPADHCLLDLIPVLKQIADVRDVRKVLDDDIPTKSFDSIVRIGKSAEG